MQNNKEATKNAAMKMLEKLEDFDMDNIESINIQLILKGKSPSKDEPCEMDANEDESEEMSDEEKMKSIGKRKKKEEDEDYEG